MSAGLFALFDDIAALTRVAAASIDDVGAAAGRASMKAAGVVVDDTAVTPQYVQGIAAERELPIVRKIATGSLRNKLLIILPVALLLSELAGWLLTPILMLGGAYLCFEGAEKVWSRIRGHGPEADSLERGPEAERGLVKAAIRTDLILSAEIMVIALNEVADQGLVGRAAILIVVAFAITALVYGVVALIVKMDDVGLRLAGRDARAAQAVGRGLVKGMPKLLAVIAAVGTVAMLWVGGHILLKGADDLGWHAPYDAVHHLEEAVGGGGAITWLVDTTCSAIVGLLIGALLVLILHLRPGKGHGDHGDHGSGAAGGDGAGVPAAAAEVGDATAPPAPSAARPAAEPSGGDAQSAPGAPPSG